MTSARMEPRNAGQDGRPAKWEAWAHGCAAAMHRSNCAVDAETAGDGSVGLTRWGGEDEAHKIGDLLL
ncbi:hypothetical protein PIB30_098322, partial [Stylosanthes scabra]|nr:hypothetical protein [Stylosanthes scabra]